MKAYKAPKHMALITLILWVVILVIDCASLAYIELSQNITRHELLVNNWDLIAFILFEIAMVYLFSWLYTSGGKNG